MAKFRVALSGDYLNDRGEEIYEDHGLDVLDEAADQVEHFYLKNEGRVIKPEQVADIDGLILLGLRVDASTLANGAERLMVIGRHGVGYDTVDVQACTENDVALFTTPPASRHPMAAASLAFMLTLGKRLPWKDRLVRENRWGDRPSVLGDELFGKTVGIVGLGNIGREVVRLLAPFEVRVVACDPYVSDDTFSELGVTRGSLDDVMSQADFLAIHCALTDETRGMINAEKLALMKPTAYFVNLARGPIVDQQALYEALRDRKIAAAAIDVFEEEPCSPDEPLLTLDNAILTPHSAGITRDFNRAMGVVDAQGMLACARGEAPPHVVNREVLSRPGFQAKLARFR